MSTRKQIILAALVGMVAGSALTQLYVRWRESEDKPNWAPVVTAFVEIKPNTRITRDMIILDMLPRDLMARDCLTSADKAEGRTSARLIRAKEQIRESDLGGR